MSYFADIERRVSATVDRVYAETVRVIFMKPGSGDYVARVQDDVYDPIDIMAIVDFNPTTVTVMDEGQYDGQQPHLAGEKIHVSFDVDKFAASRLPKKGDKISMTDRDPVQTVLLAKDPEEDGIGRIVCVCVP